MNKAIEKAQLFTIKLSSEVYKRLQKLYCDSLMGLGAILDHLYVPVGFGCVYVNAWVRA